MNGQVATAIEGLWRALGKGPAYVLVGVLEIVLAYALAVQGKDLMGFAAVMGAVNVGVFGGGAWKAHSDARTNGYAQPGPSSGPLAG